MRVLRVVVPLLSLALAAWLVLSVRAARAPRPLPARAPTEARAVRDTRVGSASASAPAVEVAVPAYPTPPCHPLGDLLVRVVDPITRAGLGGVACSVYEESDGLLLPRIPRLLRAIVTGAEGEALVEDLPSGGVVVTTPRAPPRAGGSVAARIEGGSVAECELELGFGGVLYGRVVDDRGAPVAGLEVELAPANKEVHGGRATRGLGSPATRTDAGGRFQIEAVVSGPVWSARHREASWYEREPVALYLGSSPIAPFEAPRYYVLEGEEIDAGDLVVERERVFTGTVVGADGRGLGAALVSAHRNRLDAPHAPRSVRAGPGTPEFELLPGEVRTAADGRFELQVRGDVAQALVWTERGARARFPLPRVAPGGRADALVWRLERDEVLEVALRTDGEPWEEHPAFARIPRFTGVVLESTSGERVSLPLGADADGVHRWTLPFPRDELAALDAELPDCAPARVEGDVLRTGELVEIDLEALPTLRVTLAVAAQDELRSKNVQVTACRLSPEERRRWECCGYGTTVEATVPTDRDCRLPLDLPTGGAAPHWVYVEQYAWPAEHASHAYGPFEPGDQRIDLELASPEPNLWHFDPGGTGAEREDCDVELFAVDVGGQAIGDAWPTPSSPSARIDSRGRLLERVRVTREAMTVAPLGHRPRTLQLPVMRAGELARLGEAAFQSEHGTPRIRIIDPDRAPGTPQVRLRVSTPSFDFSHELLFAGDRVRGRLVSESTAYVTTYEPEGRCRVLRTVELPPSIPDDVLELELASAVPIEVHVRGLPERAWRAPLVIEVSPAEEHPGSAAVGPFASDPSTLDLWRDALPPDRAGTRTFRAGLGPGDYVVAVKEGDFTSERLQVSEGSGPVVVELRYEGD